MMDEEIRQALTEVQEMKKMCGNINMKLANIVTQRGQDIKKKLEAEYQRGLEDAWEAAKKIALMDTETSENVTGYFGLFRIMENLTPMQAIEKLKAYEEKRNDKIVVGDEFVTATGERFVVLKVDENGEVDRYFDSEGRTYRMNVKYPSMKKTGRHFDISSILKEMQS